MEIANADRRTTLSKMSLLLDSFLTLGHFIKKN